MPSIKSSVSAYYALLIISIFLNSKIISPYSYYTKKKLVYIIILTLFSYQPSSYLKCIKANIYTLYNIRLVSINKYIFLVSVILFYLSYSLSVNTW